MKIFLIILTLVSLNCFKEGQPVEVQSNPNTESPFRVEYLFSFEGCRTYRFHDGGYAIYITRCGKDKVKTTSAHTENCGKGCSRTIYRDATVEIEK
jgi:hypothetical protein